MEAFKIQNIPKNKTLNRRKKYGFVSLYLGAITIHVAKLWDGVFGIDCYGDLTSCLVPIEPAWHNHLPLEKDIHRNKSFKRSKSFFSRNQKWQFRKTLLLLGLNSGK